MENLILSPKKYAEFNLKKARINEQIARCEYEILYNTNKLENLKKFYSEKYAVIPLVRKEAANE